MDKLTGRIALEILRNLKAREAEFNAEREEWYRAGDGRSPRYRTNPETGRSRNYGGRGWRYPYCPHGTSLWTDYDPMCGDCEDGYSVYELALWSAQEKVAEYRRRVEWVLTAPASLDHDVKADLIIWARSATK